MITIITGTALLLVTLAGFSLFSMKMPKGQAAMSGMADAAVATFLVEAILSYIAGDIFGIAFLKDVGVTSGTMGGVAAAAMVPISMGVSPVLSLCAGVACGGFGILRGICSRPCCTGNRKEASGGTKYYYRITCRGITCQRNCNIC